MIEQLRRVLIVVGSFAASMMVGCESIPPRNEWRTGVIEAAGASMAAGVGEKECVIRPVEVRRYGRLACMDFVAVTRGAADSERYELVDAARHAVIRAIEGVRVDGSEPIAPGAALVPAEKDGGALPFFVFLIGGFYDSFPERKLSSPLGYQELSEENGVVIAVVEVPMNLRSLPREKGRDELKSVQPVLKVGPAKRESWYRGAVQIRVEDGEKELAMVEGGVKEEKPPEKPRRTFRRREVGAP
jgi:hypothetical protein